MKIIFNFISLILVCILCCEIVNCMDVFQFERSEDDNHNKDLDGLCPNNKTKCSSSGTCCKTKHHSYHCCRYKDAVCCSDLFHCCPEGSTCDLEKKRCNKDPMEWKVVNDDSSASQMKKLTKSENLMVSSSFNKRLEDEPFCPNNKSRCKATKTCCITKHGNYYCCPHKNAVCCSDKWLCCPEGSTCDVKNKKCIDSTSVKKIDSSKSSKLEMTNTVRSAAESFLALFITLERHCGNSQKSCPGEKKCCAMTGSNFGCCKYRKGVCCPDFASCCPHDTQCDIKNKICTAIPDSLVPAVSIESPKNTTCPDNSTQCSNSETCCSVGNVMYGCCPMKDATCCSDKTSCCPHDKKCDIVKRRCVAKDEVSDMTSLKIKTIGTNLRKSLVNYLSLVGLTDVCPNETDKCQNDETCCLVAKNKYGCCPYKQGTCCSNMSSCCPSHTRCTENDCV